MFYLILTKLTQTEAFLNATEFVHALNIDTPNDFKAPSMISKHRQ